MIRNIRTVPARHRAPGWLPVIDEIEPALAQHDRKMVARMHLMMRNLRDFMRSAATSFHARQPRDAARAVSGALSQSLRRFAELETALGQRGARFAGEDVAVDPKTYLSDAERARTFFDACGETAGRELNQIEDDDARRAARDRLVAAMDYAIRCRGMPPYERPPPPWSKGGSHAG